MEVNLGFLTIQLTKLLFTVFFLCAPVNEN